ncbi:unnamed protein product [Rhizoctonia solani]|uniref:Autophagy-related protein 27 n=1 Tax=Rhizoctonia solani TaxID=456999 RepID=A0A8H3GU15_9AGAM|nr:unnamed protein product [Rhizoctonia solani]
MRSVAVLLSSTAAVCASTTVGLHQCILDPGPSSLHATCSSRSLSLGSIDRYEEHRYTEIALHYLDGTKDVISTSGHNPHCIPEVPDRHSISSLRAKDARPYKATWTRIRYVASSFGEGQCSASIVSEKVNAISIEALPNDTSNIEAGATSAYGVNEMVHSERPAEQLGNAARSEDVGYVPIRRRATFGELCQLLVLFMVLGALHYVSMQFAARWQAPPPMDRRSPQCE